MKKVLTIAGSDCSGGAGIQADIKTISAHNLYAMSVITALTAQNTTGVYDVIDLPSKFIEEQIDCIFNDIPPNSIKIGMVSNSDVIKSISKKLKKYNAQNIVCDPVMSSTSGSMLIKMDAVNTLINELMPLASVITPNIPEAEVLCGFKIKNKDDMQKAAQEISKTIKCPILIKGGHLSDSANDLLYENGDFKWIFGQKIQSKNTHGTGCTLSSAIACNLASSINLYNSISLAKEYVIGALNYKLDIGKGNGPLNHCFKTME